MQIKDGEIIHITDSALAVGGTVTGIIDFERRFDFMQQHSGEHIVSGVAHRLYGCENVGFHLGEDIVTLDFDKLLHLGIDGVKASKMADWFAPIAKYSKNHKSKKAKISN